MQSDTTQKMPAYSAKHPFPNKNATILCHCEERSDVAILKPLVWHPETKHGGTKRQNPKEFDPSRRDTTTALLGKRHFTRASARISHASAYFTRSKIVFHCAALPCFVPGCRLVPFQIAASGIENALLAMTKSIGFAGKRNDLRNEMYERQCEAITRKKMTAKTKTSVSQI